MSRPLDVWVGISLGATSTWALTTYTSFPLVEAAFATAICAMIGTLLTLTTGDVR
ncbi:hypothetical protein [Halovivax asiaticus]|uniref:hypothetical protein n=1 Tax=Halovivax asiaticus TaxID=332953 RepID=UPI001375BBED|nr:hypothetical protein [Halovivax asiaticus]